MKKTRRMLAMLLALVMMFTLVACGSSESSTSDTSSADAEDDATTADTADDEDDEDDEEMPTIVVMFASSSTLETETIEDIQAALNEITEEEIGVHVELEYPAIANIATTFSNMINAGEQLDLFCFNPNTAVSLGTLVSQNEVLDMTEYLEEYGQDVLELTADYIAGTTYDGKIYGVPNLRELNESYWLSMDEDLLDELGLTEMAESCDNWTTFTELMELVVEGTDGTISGIGPNDGNGSLITNYSFYVGEEDWSDSFWFDNLGDQYSFIYTDYETDTVMNYYSTEYYEYAAELVNSWYSAGLVYPDAATTDQTREAQVSGGLSMSFTGQGGPGVDTSREAKTGHSLITVELGAATIGASNVVKFGYCIPVTSQEPEAATKFLNLMYTSSEVMNLLLWGIEGVDYVINDEGEACYPEGEDGSTARYHQSEDMFPNLFISLPWDGQGSDYRETSYEELLNTPVSKYLGVSVDTSSVSDQLTACANVSSQYRAILNCGQADPTTILPEFLEALEDAGIDDIIAVYQAALDDFLAQ